MGQTYTSAQCDALLAKDLERFEKCINDLIDPPLNQTQFDALVSWSFNVGAGGSRVDASPPFECRRRRQHRISEELPRWCHGLTDHWKG